VLRPVVKQCDIPEGMGKADQHLLIPQNTHGYDALIFHDDAA
jgi:hypothetical protein